MSDETRAGSNKPERRRHNPLIVKVVTYEIVTGKVHRECVIDFNDPEKRKWYVNAIVWAVHNKHSIEVFNVADDTP